MIRDKADVLIPQNVPNPPEPHEVEAAWILARHWNCMVRFLATRQGYQAKTPDFVIRGVLWELKSPVSNSKENCVRRRLNRGTKQATSIIFDGRRTKLSDDFLIAQLKKELENRHSIQRLVFITKTSEALALK